ncbi:MAG: hypothetical protein FJZ15_06305 [Candidatus Omnitrophica bacterium]|nr:hypothetical protein [Candidatus Omnitrophota bacterium]
MSLRNKITVFIIAIIFLSAVKINQLQAAWWQLNNIPTPPNTEEVKKEKRNLHGAELDFTYYSSLLSPDDVKDFYRQKLAASGWSERDLFKGLPSMPDGLQDARGSLSGTLGNNLLFEKDKETLVITFVPAGFLQSDRTQYSICKGIIAPNPGAKTEADYIPKLETKPKKDIAPAYPGSSLISLAEDQHSLKSTYFTKDTIDSVAAFFRDKMPAYGWMIVKEMPLKKLDYGNMNVSEYCPSCVKDSGVSDKPVDVLSGGFNFRNSRGDVCSIILSDVAPIEKTTFASGMTLIYITYNENR